MQLVAPIDAAMFVLDPPNIDRRLPRRCSPHRAASRRGLGGGAIDPATRAERSGGLSMKPREAALDVDQRAAATRLLDSAQVPSAECEIRAGARHA